MANNNNNKLTPADSWCRTKACEEVKYTFKWVIDKFRDRPEENAQVNVIGMNVEFCQAPRPGQVQRFQSKTNSKLKFQSHNLNSRDLEGHYQPPTTKLF